MGTEEITGREVKSMTSLQKTFSILKAIIDSTSSIKEQPKQRHKSQFPLTIQLICIF